MRRLAHLGLALVMTPLCGDSSIGQTPPQMVDVGGYRLETLVHGTGEPAVVLLSGGRSGLEKWKDVVPLVEEHTTVVAYTRGGLGGSEVGDVNRTVVTVAHELANLLDALEIKDPVVLAGYSRGGIHIRVFAALYPERVAGLVFVEASHERQYLKHGEIDSTFWPDVVPTLRENYAQLGEAVDNEWLNFLEIQRTGKLPVGETLPDVPTAVLTGLKTEPDESDDFVRVWRALHDELFGYTSSGLRVVTDQSGHQMVATEPALVADAIRWVVDRVRSGGR